MIVGRGQAATQTAVTLPGSSSSIAPHRANMGVFSISDWVVFQICCGVLVPNFLRVCIQMITTGCVVNS